MNTEQNEDRPTEEVILPGEMLRQAREQLGYSQEDIASRLRLRLSVINDIEENNFEQAQLATFTRGYVRSYAKYVGLNEAEVLAKLDQQGHAQPQEQEMQSFSRRTKREAHDSRVMSLTWAVAFILVGLTGVWWWQNQPVEPETEVLDTDSQQVQPLDESLANTFEEGAELSAPEISSVAETASLVAGEPEVVEPVVAPEPVAPGNLDDSFSSESDTAALAVEETDTADSLAAMDTPNATAEEAVAAVVSDLQLTFSGDCWVDIRDANGKRLDTGIKKTGDVLNLDGVAPFKVVLGAPGVVKMSYKGEPVDLSEYPVGKVARLKLPQ